MALARTHQQARSLVRRQAPCVTQARQLHLTPREADHLQLHQVGALAQKRLARGLRLNQPEAVGLISTVMLEKIRDGKVQAAGAIIGAVMKAMRGQADAARVRELILERAAQ